MLTSDQLGIGLETAKECAQRGANLTILCRNEEKMKASLEQLNAIRADCARGIKCDLKSFDSVREAAAETAKARGSFMTKF